MLRCLLGLLVVCAPLVACGGNDRPPAIDLNASPGAGGSDDGEPSGGKPAAKNDLREGGFIHLPQVSDISYDDRRGLLYVTTTSGGLATVKLDNGKMATDAIGQGPLLGLDLSPSGDLLAICENSVDEDSKQYWLHIADLESRTRREIFFDQYYDLQEGTHHAAFADDRTVFLASSFVASGYVPFIRVNLDDDSQEELSAVVSDTMFARSLDNRRLVFVEPKDGSGPVNVIDTRTFVKIEFFVNQLLHDVAIDASGSRLALPGPDQVKVRSVDASGEYTLEATIDYPQREARAAVFSPDAKSLYVTWGKTPDSLPFVERYDAETLESQGLILKGIELADEREGGFVPTRMKISNDGTLLFITVETGINVIRVDP